MKLRTRYQWVRLAQISMTFGLIAVLLRQISLSDILSVMSGMHWGFYLLSLSLLLICHLLNVARWQCVLQIPAISYGKLLTIYGASLFGNNFLPSGIGGDGIRAILVSRDVSLKRAIFSVGLDRAVGTLDLSVILAIGLWLGPPAELNVGKFYTVLPYALWILGGILVTLAIVGLPLLIFWRATPHLRQRLEKFRVALTFHKLKSFDLGYWTRLFSTSFALAACSQLSLVAAYWMALQALSIQSPVGASFWLVLIGSASLLLPISINGLGLQEGIYVVLLASYAVPTTVALAFGILIRLQMVFFALIGGLLSLKSNGLHITNRI